MLGLIWQLVAGLIGRQLIGACPHHPCLFIQMFVIIPFCIRIARHDGFVLTQLRILISIKAHNPRAFRDRKSVFELHSPNVSLTNVARVFDNWGF